MIKFISRGKDSLDVRDVAPRQGLIKTDEKEAVPVQGSRSPTVPASKNCFLEQVAWMMLRPCAVLAGLGTLRLVKYPQGCGSLPASTTPA